MPKVSIITSAYNSAAFIRTTIDSVLGQMFTDYEYIIVDDGSTDTTASIIKSYVQNFPKTIKYIHQANGGPAKARNRGIEEARGEYIALIDADDAWFPDRLAQGVKFLDENPGVALVHSQIVQIDEQGQRLPKQERDPRGLSGRIFFSLILRKAHIACPTVLFRKKLLEKIGLFDEAPQCIGAEDRDLWLRLTREFPVHFINQELGYYRVHAAGLSQNSERMLANKIYVINKNTQKPGEIILKQRALGRLYKEIGDEYLIGKNFSTARSYYCKSIACWPFLIWAWWNLGKVLKK